MALHAAFEIGFDLGPFLRNDAEPVAVARGAIGHDDMVAEDSLVFCAERPDGGLRFQILMVGLEGDASRTHFFKGMAKL